MNTFRTVLPVIASSHKINLKSSLLTIGSCFSDSIGDRLKRNKFKVSVNPLGAVYNPISIHQIIQTIIQNKLSDENSFILF